MAALPGFVSSGSWREGRHRDDDRGIQLAVVVGKLALERHQPERQRPHAVVLQDHQRHREFVPGRNEIEDQQRGENGQRHGQEDAAKDREVRSAVDQRGLAEFLGNVAEEAVQNEHLIRHAEGEIRQDDAEVGVDQAELIDERE